MAMNGTTLGDAMYAAVKTAVEANDAQMPPEAQAAFRAMGEAIVAHIQANAVVPDGIAVSVNIGTGIGTTTADGTVT